MMSFFIKIAKREQQMLFSFYFKNLLYELKKESKGCARTCLTSFSFLTYAPADGCDGYQIKRQRRERMERRARSLLRRHPLGDGRAAGVPGALPHGATKPGDRLRGVPRFPWTRRRPRGGACAPISRF